MSMLYSTTIKYFRLSIAEFLPELLKAKQSIQEGDTRERTVDLIEAYEDIAQKIDAYGLNLEDPNRFYDGEPADIEIGLPDKMIENLSRLSVRLFLSWKKREKYLQEKEYLTEANKDELIKLGALIWPLEALLKEKSYVLGKYADLGALNFPYENTGTSIPTDPVLETVSTDDIKTIKNRFKAAGLFVESRSQDEDQHLLIGKRDGTPDKAHVVIDGKTGDIRVEDNQQEPTDLVAKIEAILTLPDGKKIRITREAIDEFPQISEEQGTGSPHSEQLAHTNGGGPSQRRPSLDIRNNGHSGGPDGNSISFIILNDGQESARNVRAQFVDGERMIKESLLGTITTNGQSSLTYEYTNTVFFLEKLSEPKIVLFYNSVDGRKFMSGVHLIQEPRNDGRYNLSVTLGESFDAAS